MSMFIGWMGVVKGTLLATYFFPLCALSPSICSLLKFCLALAKAEEVWDLLRASLGGAQSLGGPRF